MKKIRTLVVDDEPLARSRILNLLRRTDYISVIGESKNGREALEMIDNYRPDLVFLDIQMPDLNGFDVLARTPPEELPFIIFVTAYDQYALQAFDVHAVDYLLKPYDDDRFFRALDHARRQIGLKENALLQQKMVQLINEFQQQKETDSIRQITIKDKGVTHHVLIDDIHYIEAHGNYLKIYEGSSAHLLRQTMQNMIDAINKPYFLRIHRSLFLNTHYVDRIRYSGNNQYSFRMKNGDTLLSSRGHKEEIEQHLKEENLRRKLDEQW